MSQISIKQFSNGLKTILVPIQTSQSVTLMFLARVGSRYEETKSNGLAHFVEHMFFKGSKRYPSSKEVGMAIEKIGGTSNAFTSFDNTAYFIKIPKENVISALDILSDMIKNGRFDEEEMEREKGVIIEEIRMYEDRPMSKASSLWDKYFFGDNGLGRSIAGEISTVSEFKQQAFIDFVKRYYTANNSLFIATGDIDTNALTQEIELRFQDLPKGELNRFELLEPKKQEARVSVFTKDVEQTHIVLGGYGIKRDHPQKYSIELSNAILSEGFGSRLFQVIREELGLAYYVYSSFDEFEELGVFKIGLGVENSKVELAVEAVVKELKHLIAGDFDEEELERARNYLVGKLVTNMEQTDDYALWYGLQELLDSKHDSLVDAKRKILSISKEDIVKALNECIAGQPLQLVAVRKNADLNKELRGILKI